MSQQADPVIEFVVRLARERLKPARGILFGSRARGDHRERSDYDFAFDVPGVSHSDWARFVLDAQEQAPTLCGLDLVNLSEVRGEFLAKILAEGKDLL